MNRALPEMLHCLNTQGNIHGNCTEISVFERQQARMKWQQLQQQQQQQQNFYNGNDFSSLPPLAHQNQQEFSGLDGNMMPSLDDLMIRVIKPDPGMENGWPDFGKFGGDGDGQLGYGYGNMAGPGFDQMNQNSLIRMTSCPPAVADHTVLQGNSSSASLSPKKRKADKNLSLKVVTGEETKEKRIKGCADEGDSKITQQYTNSNKGNNNKAVGNSDSNNKNTAQNNKSSNSKENSAETSSKEKSKVSEVQKPDYIHVRARRGQATDSHSLAERVRREKISERMKYLQDLVPGCNKITGKAGMLDEIINYVQSLQRQVEFLSMKLATVNPRLDFNIDNLLTKEMIQSTVCDFPAVGTSEMANAAYFQLSSLEQMASCCGLEMGINPTDMALRRTISPPVSLPETFLESSCFNQIQPPCTWDADLQNLYRMEFQQGTSTPFQSQQFTGSNGGSNLKMEI